MSYRDPRATNVPHPPVSVPAISDGERLDEVNESLRLIQRTEGLTFGTDAYLLAAMLKPYARRVGVELGGGTGIVSLLALTKNKLAHAHIWELQPEYAALCRRNAILNGLDGRVTVHEGDIRTALPTAIGAEADVVFSNPPYMLPGAGRDSRTREMNIARREENGTIADFCAAAARLLPSGGSFYVVYRPERMAELFSALRAARLEPKRMVTVYPDAASRPCLILVEARRGGAPSLHQAPPLMIYQSGGERVYTSVMQRIYDTFSMEFLFETRKERRL